MSHSSPQVIKFINKIYLSEFLSICQVIHLSVCLLICVYQSVSSAVVYWDPPHEPRRTDVTDCLVLVSSWGSQKLPNFHAHHVSGTVYLLDERTVMLTQFNFDGNAPGTNVCTREAKEWGRPLGTKLEPWQHLDHVKWVMNNSVSILWNPTLDIRSLMKCTGE